MSDIVLCAAIIVMLIIGWRDFASLRISNTSVLVLLGLYGAFAATKGFEGILNDIIAGAVLFGVTFIFWLFRAIGAGDVKLYLPLGFFVGLDNLAPFALALTAASLLLLVLIKIGGRLASGTSYFGRRLKELRASGKVPYGVPMGLGAIAVIVAERFGGISLFPI
ncbi:MAG: prepilin peptidase [Pseudomonadota bacterium]